MIYIASPYSHPELAVRQARFERVVRYAGFLINQGLVIYSPIVHNHPIAVRCGLPTGFDFWRKFDEQMVRMAEEVRVFADAGWHKSVGVQQEIEIANGAGIKVSFFVPVD